MGNELNNEEESDKEENGEKDNIKFGLISRKYDEKANNDNYIISPNIKFVEDDKSKVYSLFGIFSGHNNNYISNYLSENITTFFNKEIKNIDNKNYINIIEGIFKEIDMTLRKEQKFEIKDNNEEDIINIEINGINEKEKENIKNSIKNSQNIPDDLKEIDDNELENLLLFKNLFDSQKSLFKNKNNLNYIGASTSLVIINKEDIIKIELGITKCFLLDKNGNILKPKTQDESNNENQLEDNEFILRHKFNNKKEKKRIKQFHKDIDFESLIINPYIPTSRGFGFFKYKENDILKEENQIISCIPDIEIFDKKNVDFIFLISSLEINNNGIKKLSVEIKNLSENKTKDIKYSELIDELLKYFQKENLLAKNENNEIKKSLRKHNYNLNFGKDNSEEENIFLNELDENYYNDVIELNKITHHSENSTVTCILIKLNKDKDKNEIIDEKLLNKDKEEKIIPDNVRNETERNEKVENKIEALNEN